MKTLEIISTELDMTPTIFFGVICRFSNCTGIVDKKSYSVR